eukprot:360892-Chlamydomonas_euryale.AAC.4
MGVQRRRALGSAEVPGISRRASSCKADASSPLKIEVGRACSKEGRVFADCSGPAHTLLEHWGDCPHCALCLPPPSVPRALGRLLTLRSEAPPPSLERWGDCPCCALSLPSPPSSVGTI